MILIDLSFKSVYPFWFSIYLSWDESYYEQNVINDLWEFPVDKFVQRNRCIVFQVIKPTFQPRLLFGVSIHKTMRINMPNSMTFARFGRVTRSSQSSSSYKKNYHLLQSWSRVHFYFDIVSYYRNYNKYLYWKLRVVIRCNKICCYTD